MHGTYASLIRKCPHKALTCHLNVFATTHPHYLIFLCELIKNERNIQLLWPYHLPLHLVLPNLQPQMTDLQRFVKQMVELALSESLSLNLSVEDTLIKSAYSQCLVYHKSYNPQKELELNLMLFQDFGTLLDLLLPINDSIQSIYLHWQHP